MSQLAREYNKFIIFRHQTIYVKIIINNFINKLLRNYLFNLIRINYLENKNICTYNNAEFNKIIKLDPYYITGFVDGEGCFLINVHRRLDCKLGYYVSLAFKIKLHTRDLIILNKIKDFFNQKGTVIQRKDGYSEYIVTSIKDIECIIHHFDKYFLVTQKSSDNMLFKQVYELVKSKEHLTIEGL